MKYVGLVCEFAFDQALLMSSLLSDVNFSGLPAGINLVGVYWVSLEMEIFRYIESSTLRNFFGIVCLPVNLEALRVSLLDSAPDVYIHRLR